MQLSDLTAMLSNPPPSTNQATVGQKEKGKDGGDAKEFNNWSDKGAAEIILPLVVRHPKVRLFKRKPTSILNLTSLQLSNMEAPLERFKDLP